MIDKLLGATMAELQQGLDLAMLRHKLTASNIAHHERDRFGLSVVIENLQKGPKLRI